MKQSAIIFVIFAFITISCNNTGKTQENKSGDANKTMEESASFVYDTDSLYAVAETLIDKPITIRGFVSHTCEHSGKRCFLTDENEEYSIRVEAKGDIGRFDRELVGSELEVNGIVRERQLSRNEISDMESNLNTKREKEESSKEECDAELANINEMKEWMKTRGKDYYSIYFIDGLSYRIISN